MYLEFIASITKFTIGFHINFLKNLYKFFFKKYQFFYALFGLVWFGLVLWHVIYSRIFKAKYISIQINTSISTISV